MFCILFFSKITFGGLSVCNVFLFFFFLLFEIDSRYNYIIIIAKQLFVQKGMRGGGGNMGNPNMMGGGVSFFSFVDDFAVLFIVLYLI
jgi:hypothetical protein